MEMTASPAMTTPRSSRWSSASRTVSSISWSAMSLSFCVHRSCEAVRRPRARERDRHAVRSVSPVQIVAQLLEFRFFVAVEQDIDLRKSAAALHARFGHRLACELARKCLLDFTHHLLLRFARCAFLLIIEFLPQQICLARRRAL